MPNHSCISWKGTLVGFQLGTAAIFFWSVTTFAMVTLWLTNITMEHHHAINGYIRSTYINYKWPFSIAMLVYQRVKVGCSHVFLVFTHQWIGR